MTETQSTIMALAQTARDTSKPIETRREALRHLALLRGEPTGPVDTIPEDELSSVASALTAFGQIGFADLTLADVLEGNAQARLRREYEQARR